MGARIRARETGFGGGTDEQQRMYVLRVGSGRRTKRARRGIVLQMSAVLKFELALADADIISSYLIAYFSVV